jgi:hypothetical protein
MSSAPLYQSPLKFLNESGFKNLINKKSYELTKLQTFTFKNGNDIITKNINVNNISSLDQLFFQKDFEPLNINLCVYGSLCVDKKHEHKKINHILDNTNHLDALSVLLHIKDSIGLFQKKFKQIFDGYSKNLNILDNDLMDKLLHERRLIQLNYLRLLHPERYNRYINILHNSHKYDDQELKNFLCLQVNESLHSFFEKFIVSITNRISTIESAIKGDIRFLDENNISYNNQDFIWHNDEYKTYFDLFQININTSHNDINTKFRKLALIYHPDKVLDSSKKEENEEKYKFILNVKETLLNFNKEKNIFFLKDKLTYLEHYYLYITSFVDKDQKKMIKLQKYMNKKKSYNKDNNVQESKYNDDDKMDISVSSVSDKWADQYDSDDDDINQKFNDLDINKKNIDFPQKKIKCKYFSIGFCKSGNNCNFKHEINSAKPHNFKTVPCSFFKKGKCSKGENCTYSHTM